MGLTSSSSTNLPPAYDGDRKEKAVTYIPCTQSLLTNPRRSNKAGKKVLVVGAGCAGLGAAWHLNRAGVDVTVFEELGKLGGHANTVNGKSSHSFHTALNHSIIRFSYFLQLMVLILTRDSWFTTP